MLLVTYYSHLMANKPRGSPFLQGESIFSTTAGSSMQAITFSAPPQAWQVSMSMPNIRFERCAQLIEARRSTGVGACPSPVALGLSPLPRAAFVPGAGCLLFGANTPWKRVRLARGLGTRAASPTLRDIS